MCAQCLVCVSVRGVFPCGPRIASLVQMSTGESGSVTRACAYRVHMMCLACKGRLQNPSVSIPCSHTVCGDCAARSPSTCPHCSVSPVTLVPDHVMRSLLPEARGLLVESDSGNTASEQAPSGCEPALHVRVRIQTAAIAGRNTSTVHLPFCRSSSFTSKR